MHLNNLFRPFVEAGVSALLRINRSHEDRQQDWEQPSVSSCCISVTYGMIVELHSL